MISTALALAMLLGMAQDGSQPDGWSETTFHRVYLRNGNFLDGKVIADKANEVILLLKAGEMAIRRDQIDNVQLMKMRSYNEKPLILAAPKKAPVADPKTPVKPETPAVNVDTPEAIKKRVDAILFKFKNTPGAEKEIPITDMKPLGEDGAVYLAARIPAFDEKTQLSMGVCLIQLNDIKPSEKVKSILEGHLGNATANVRMVAVNVLGGVTNETEKFRMFPNLLKDPDQKVRLHTMAALGNVQGKDFFEVLLDSCSDTDPDIRGRALRTCLRLSEAHNLAETFIKTLSTNVKHIDKGVRTDNAGVIGALKVKDTAQLLVPLLNDPDAPVRAAAAQSLISLADPAVGNDIAEALGREREKEVQIPLIGAAQKVRANKAIEPMIHLLDSIDNDVKSVALKALRVMTGQSLDASSESWTNWLKTKK